MSWLDELSAGLWKVIRTKMEALTLRTSRIVSLEVVTFEYLLEIF